jgi:hypothetical protein
MCSVNLGSNSSRLTPASSLHPPPSFAPWSGQQADRDQISQVMRHVRLLQSFASLRKLDPHHRRCSSQRPPHMPAQNYRSPTSCSFQTGAGSSAQKNCRRTAWPPSFLLLPTEPPQRLGVRHIVCVNEQENHWPQLFNYFRCFTSHPSFCRMSAFLILSTTAACTSSKTRRTTM